MNLSSSILERDVLVVGGSGGVGKTTTSAALAIGAANSTDRRVLVVTMDPARRLADVLGVELGGSEPVRVKTDGSLHAVMLDTKQAWDRLVERHAPDARTASSILANPLYEQITARFVQSHDYIAMEMLYELHGSGRFDLIVVDTPPSAHAVDFLDAPDRMASFFDSRLLKFLVAPAKMSLRSVTSRAFLQLADRLLGRRFLADITELFGMLETMRPGFIERAEHVKALLRDERTAFVAVTTPEPGPALSAEVFARELDRRGLQRDAVIVNRALPSFLSQPVDRSGAGEGAKDPLELALLANHDRLASLAHAQRRAATEGGVVASVEVPWMTGDISDVTALEQLGARLLSAP